MTTCYEQANAWRFIFLKGVNGKTLTGTNYAVFAPARPCQAARRLGWGESGCSQCILRLLLCLCNTWHTVGLPCVQAQLVMT